ncbi:hypothetical protein DVH24_027434 [Malus domestica]|uniref:Uncharacterized protein n=1 Tax=Malus domestica TaxID=3750 RepID=A0A498HAL6_MALDO|nr:hypothetical protein DVH24_027434 [Malus domestica]
MGRFGIGVDNIEMTCVLQFRQRFGLARVRARVQMTKLARKCDLEHFEAVLGQEWIAHAWSKVDGLKEARNVLQIWKNQIKTWRIRNQLKRKNIIQTNLILSNIIQNLILSYPNLILIYLISSCKEGI